MTETLSQKSRRKVVIMLLISKQADLGQEAGVFLDKNALVGVW
jgi:hypothetical protein